VIETEKKNLLYLRGGGSLPKCLGKRSSSAPRAGAKPASLCDGRRHRRPVQERGRSGYKRGCCFLMQKGQEVIVVEHVLLFKRTAVLPQGLLLYEEAKLRPTWF